MGTMASWLVTFFSGVLSAVAGGLGMLGIATLCVKWYRISSFEGGSGYFVVGLALLGFIGGFVVGLIAARVGYMQIGPHWYIQIATSLGTVACLLLVVLTYSYLESDHVLEQGGRGLVVAWEVRLPKPNPSDPFDYKGNPQEWPDSELRLQLVSIFRGAPRGFSEAEFDRLKFHLEGDQWILPAKVPLFTSKGDFCVNLTLGGRDDGFWPPLSAFPSDADFSWSPWYRTNKSQDKPTDFAAVMYRFRYERGESKE
jgi:hypothetical protein